ncbi:MAG: heme-dependent peroxidase [Deltaproteobacteria bacterium]|nr:heme-dependent peroxidase [Deltaproteobacteria bacterium]
MPDQKLNASTTDNALPAVPLTLDGSFVLHQMFRIAWPAWKAASPAEQSHALEEALAVMGPMEQPGAEQSALFSMVGHKADLMILHFRRAVEGLNAAEVRLANLKIARFLEPTTSYLSVVELGLYEISVRLYTLLTQRGLQPHTPEWSQAVEAELEKQRKAASSRLWPEIPAKRYVCFYPMNKLRGEIKNWYQTPMDERRRMMHEHGFIGRKYGGQVTQIISGSIGFDDWEWGVDLFADDPLVFKKLVYEMRFDEASAVYGQFGAFYFGFRLAVPKLAGLLQGKLPDPF